MNDPHAAHVAKGYCPSIDWSKAWCNAWRDHEGQHWAPYFHPDGTFTNIYWNEGRTWSPIVEAAG